MNCSELSIDVEDSRRVYVLSMRYVCAQLTDRTKKRCVAGEGCRERRKKRLCSQEIFCHGEHIAGPLDEILMYNLFICELTSFLH